MNKRLEAQGAFAKKLHSMYDKIETKYHPDVRWWLAEGLNTDETLRKNVKEIHDNGFGAAEFLAMPEPSADSKIYGWGSEEWTSDSRLIIDETTKHGLGFSMTSGAHWANANLPDTYTWQGEAYNPDNKAASKELDYATILVKGGETYDADLPLPKKPEAVAGDMHGSAATYTTHVFQGAVAAKVVKTRENCGQEFGYDQGKGTGVIDFENIYDLTGNVTEKDGACHLQWTAPDNGEYVLFAYWMHGTSQTASPSVSVNYTINYMDRYGVDALIDYWEEVVLNDELKEKIRENGRGEIYMDSLELLSYGAGGVFWGYHFKEEFKARKGYDITKYLPLMTMDGARIDSRNSKKYDYAVEGEAANAEIKKVRNDMYNVMSDMYVENVLRPLQTWLHSLNMTLRAEPSYGTNFEISTPAKYVDGIETESFAQTSDVDLFRGQSGSANMYGRLFSSETGAVGGHNYVYNMDEWTQVCYLQFSEGVARTVFHGYSAIEGSEEDTYWPGHEGMYAFFSDRFNSRQPASTHYKEWTTMLARNQKVLRQGNPLRDIAILRTDYFYINYGKPKGYDTFATNYMMHDKTYFWNDLSLQAAGYTYDYFSPLLLEDEENVAWTDKLLQPQGPSYKAVILYQEDLELAPAKRLLKIAQAGIPVLFVNNNTEILAHDGAVIAHGKAASVSKSLKDSDAELAEVVNAIKALSNSAEVDSPAEALEALKKLGVTPRVAFDKPNLKVMTCSRIDRANGIFYTFAYSYKFEVAKGEPAYTFDMVIEAEGTPYAIDDWTGEIRRIGLYRVENGCTVVTVTLIPGQSQLIAIDTNDTGRVHAVETNACAVYADDGALNVVAGKTGTYETKLCCGKVVETTVTVPEAVEISKWDIDVEDWNEGEKVVNVEEKFGHVTREAYYTTKKTHLLFKDSPLVAWKDLPATADQLATLAGEDAKMADISGVANYTSAFELPENWCTECNGARFCVENAGGGTVVVYVNGEKASVMNARTLVLDISFLVHAGRNDIRVEVTSTLSNRMIQRGYGKIRSGWTDEFPGIRAYGLQGKATVEPYAIAEVKA